MAPFKSSKGKDSIVSKFLKISAASKLGLGLGAAADSSVPFVASGGTISATPERKIHLFETPGTFTVAQGSTNIDIIIVGGGGRSGEDRGGGGGGGGVYYRVLEPVGTGYEKDIVIGNGGGQGGNANGNAGGNSTWGSPGPEQYIAYGGGAGYGIPGTNAAATGGGKNGNGGSGPGGSGNLTIPGGTTITQGNNSLPVQGFPGGAGTDSAPRYGGGGGGGAGGAGGDGTNTLGGDGGIGLGPPTWSWLPTMFGDDGYFGGGGAGGNIDGPNATGGKGGGGDAQPTGTPTAGSNGTGGGGGGGGNGSGNSANGGKGAVLVSYPI